MGFKLDCPNCGSRAYEEFWFGGEVRPHDPLATDEEDYRHTWLRVNAAGPQQERWFHYGGCRRWMSVVRDTRDNAIASEAGPDASH